MTPADLTPSLGGIAVDEAGNLVVIDRERGNHALLLVSEAGADRPSGVGTASPPLQPRSCSATFSYT